MLQSTRTVPLPRAVLRIGNWDDVHLVWDSTVGLAVLPAEGANQLVTVSRAEGCVTDVVTTKRDQSVTVVHSRVESSATAVATCHSVSL